MSLSTLDALRALRDGRAQQEVAVIGDVVKMLRATRKVYHYDYSAEDAAAVRACATDLRPFTHGALPAGAAYWGLGALLGRSALGGGARLAAALVRLAAAAKAYQLGRLAGEYRQAVDCTRRLVALPTPLGGEVAALLRERDPGSALLRFERPPLEQGEDGCRPRIRTESNRLARLAQLRRELEAAKQALRPDGAVAAAAAPAVVEQVGRALRSAEQQPDEADSLSALAQHGAAADGGARSVPSVVRAEGGGLVIADHHPVAAAQQRQRELQAAAAAADAAAPSRSSGGAAQGGEADLLVMLLGGGGALWGEGPAEEAQRQAAEEEEARARRRRKRSQWWRRRGGGAGEEAKL